MLAHELGNLRLSLRRPNDVSEQSGDGVADIDTLLSQRPERADEQGDRVDIAPGNAGFVDWLKSHQDSQPQGEAPSAPIAATADIEPQIVFEMLVLKPDGPTFYRWRDLGQLPEVVPVANAGWSASALNDPAATDGTAESKLDGSHVDDDAEDSS